MEADYLENTVVIDESNLTAEQQLGLKQAEERLERDYISRLEKVGWVIYQIKKRRWISSAASFFIIVNHFGHLRY